jgi:hypothetical protein
LAFLLEGSQTSLFYESCFNMSKVITIASLLNLYREAGLPIVASTHASSESIGIERSAATYHWGRKVTVWQSPLGVCNKLLGQHLRHEFVHHLQWLQDRKTTQPLGKKRDSNPLPKGVSASYWECPIEAEARYYEYNPVEFDKLVQKHGYTAVEWESTFNLYKIAAVVFATAAIFAGVTYSLGSKVTSLQTDNQYLRQQNAELLERLDKHDPCAIIANVEEEESCRP